MKTAKRIGILGGTFDPIHYGHLAAAESARCEYQLDQVLFIPSACPPHKPLYDVSASRDRFIMVQKAIQDNPYFEVSALEMERKGYSYTVDTLDYFLQEYPGVEMYFILGIDALLLINTWKEVDRLVGLCKFAAVTRPGYHINRDDPSFDGLPEILWQNLHILKIPGNLVSSSELRKRVAEGKPIKYLVPPQVEEYIFSQGLYRDGNYNK